MADWRPSQSDKPRHRDSPVPAGPSADAGRRRAVLVALDAALAAADWTSVADCYDRLAGGFAVVAANRIARDLSPLAATHAAAAQAVLRHGPWVPVAVGIGLRERDQDLAAVHDAVRRAAAGLPASDPAAARAAAGLAGLDRALASADSDLARRCVAATVGIFTEVGLSYRPSAAAARGYRAGAAQCRLWLNFATDHTSTRATAIPVAQKLTLLERCRGDLISAIRAAGRG